MMRQVNTACCEPGLPKQEVPVHGSLPYVHSVFFHRVSLSQPFVQLLGLCSWARFAGPMFFCMVPVCREVTRDESPKMVILEVGHGL
jgi:hypothetical protein